MTWTSQTYSFGSLLTAAKMTALYDNITAVANGDAGAPLIQQAAIDASAVGQGELKTTTASGNTTVATTGTSVTLTGGTYSWWTAGASTTPITFGNGDTGAGVIGLASYSVSGTFHRDERYVQASPPYDLGDGEIPLFIYAMIDNATGEIVNIEVAQDPTWCNHGPTILTPTRKLKMLDGTLRKFRNELVIGDGVPINLARKKHKKLFADYLAGKIEPVYAEIEITKEYKNSDCETHSHPWIYNKEEYFAGRSIIMLDPFCKDMKLLADIYHAAGARQVINTINEGFAFDNQALNRKTPSSLKAHGIRYKK